MKRNNLKIYSRTITYIHRCCIVRVIFSQRYDVWVFRLLTEERRESVSSYIEKIIELYTYTYVIFRRY